MIVMESLMDAMQEETLVRRVNRHLPEKLFPLHYTIGVEALNQAAKDQLVSGTGGSETIKVYVFDENCKKKPFGAWGRLYVMDHKPAKYLDEITNPYGPGTLYDTGRTARILPDGSLDFLEQIQKNASFRLPFVFSRKTDMRRYRSAPLRVSLA